MTLLQWGAAAVLALVTSVSATAANVLTSFTVVHTFSGADGASPNAGLVRGTDGNFYGTTIAGGDMRFCGEVGCGTVFKLTPSGRLTVLHKFRGTDGAQPVASLAQSADGTFYGTTRSGGTGGLCSAYGCGTVFRITPNGKFSTLHFFGLDAGNQPAGAVVVANDGDLYGSTYSGGQGVGTLFRMTPQGQIVFMHSLAENEGQQPTASLMQASDQNFYATTNVGGDPNSGFGTALRMTPTGEVFKLRQYGPVDVGTHPYGFVEGSDGFLYGTTASGAGNGCQGFGCGAIYRMSKTGDLVTALHVFSGQDGFAARTPPMLAADGNLYGTTWLGGVPGQCAGYLQGCGVVYRISTSNGFQVLHVFDDVAAKDEGTFPLGGLVEGTPGCFYGTTSQGGGTVGAGTIYRICMRRR